MDKRVRNFLTQKLERLLQEASVFRLRFLNTRETGITLFVMVRTGRE